MPTPADIPLPAAKPRSYRSCQHRSFRWRRQESAMNLTTESVPTVWTSADESFFAIAHELFAPDFLAGAGVLLASYDSDAQPANRSAQPTGSGNAAVARAAR